MTIDERLERLKNHRTRYELAATHADGRKVLIRYTPRQGRRGLYKALIHLTHQNPRILTISENLAGFLPIHLTHRRRQLY